MSNLLSTLLQNVVLQQIKGNLDTPITQLCTDSRLAKPGSLFVALSGTQTDGHKFIDKAIEQGASAILCETMPNNDNNISDQLVCVQVKDTAAALGQIASAFYHHPSGQLKLIGITGTNGKTTTATLLFKLFRSLGYACGLISTVQYQINNTVYTSTHTTPDVIRFNELLAQMVEEGCDYAFAEVSSHAVVQQRIAGLEFAGGLFSNITPDQPGYHGTFCKYL